MNEWKEIFQFSRAEIFALSILLLMALVGGGVLLYQNSTQTLPPELFFQSAAATPTPIKSGAAPINNLTQKTVTEGNNSRTVTARASDKPATLTLNINTAPIDSLMLLPRVGQIIGQRIVELRQRLGQFDSVGQLIAVRGIGKKTLEQIRPHVTVGNVPSTKPALVDTIAIEK